MKCKDARKQLIFLSDKENKPGLFNAVRQHLTQCKNCREEYRTIEEFYGIIEKEKMEKVNPFLFDRILAKVGNPTPEESNGLLPAWVNNKLKLALATLLVIAGIASGIYTGNMVSPEVIAQTTYQTDEFYFDDVSIAGPENYLLNDKEPNKSIIFHQIKHFTGSWGFC